MIILKLNSKNGDVKAMAKYNETNGEVTVLKGSKVSETIAGGTFRSARSVEKQRQGGIVRDSILLQDITFKSASSAANFVTGRSTNGLLAWKDENGTKLKDLIDVVS